MRCAAYEYAFGVAGSVRVYEYAFGVAGSVCVCTSTRLGLPGACLCVCGCVAVWLCGCVAVWLCGCVAVWLFFEVMEHVGMCRA